MKPSFDEEFHSRVSNLARWIFDEFPLTQLCIHIARKESVVSSIVTHQDTFVFGDNLRDTLPTERFCQSCILEHSSKTSKTENTSCVIYNNHVIAVTTKDLEVSHLHGVAGMIGMLIRTMGRT